MADDTGRHAVDACLRRHGFKIHARPSVGEPRWQRHGAVLSQREALALIPREEVKRAKKSQKQYLERLCR